MADVSPTKAPEDVKELLKLCRAGRLYQRDANTALEKAIGEAAAHLLICLSLSPF
jgi:hypothetical protein